MQHVVIFGANIGVVPLIWNLRRRGVHVLVLGHDPAQIGAQLADEFCIINYRDPESIAQVLEGRSVDGLVPGAHDLYLRAYSEYLDYSNSDGLGRLAFYEILHNKMHFRKLLQNIAPSRCPEFLCPEDFDTFNEHDFLFPALYKPEHAGGGRGIFKLSNFAAFQEQRQELNYGIVERWIPGVDLSISIWLSNGRCIANYADREVTLGASFRITGSISSNGLIKEIRLAGIMDELTAILNQMGITTGFVHCQIRMTTLADWHVIEFTRRIPGDAYPLVPEMFGHFDYSSCYLSEFIPRIVAYPHPQTSFKFVSDRAFGRVCLFRRQQLLPNYISVMEIPTHLPESSDAYSVSLLVSRKAIPPEILLESNLQIAAGV